MDCKQVIKRNREALAVVIAGLIAMVGQRDTIPRPLRRSILRILRPAESALRRLIVIAATMLQGKARKGEANPRLLPDFASFARRDRQAAFRLIDPRKRFGQTSRPTGLNMGIPRISVPGFTEPILVEPVSKDAMNSAAILRRIAALDHALKTLPRQARRLNRLMQHRAKAEPGPGRTGPILPGLPPGYRKRATEPVDDILRDCHYLVFETGFKPP